MVLFLLIVYLLFFFFNYILKLQSILSYALDEQYGHDRVRKSPDTQLQAAHAVPSLAWPCDAVGGGGE